MKAKAILGFVLVRRFVETFGLLSMRADAAILRAFV
jgi:hypothetical protein